MDIRYNINRINSLLSSKHEDVEIKEKASLKFGNYFEISIKESKEVKIVIPYRSIDNSYNFNFFYYSNPLNEDSDLNTWSVEEYKNSILIKFSFNTEFKDYIKELGGTWMVAKKAWMFPKSNQDDILESITTKFPKWSFVNTIPV